MALTFALNSTWRHRRGEFWIDELSRVTYATATALILHMAITFYFRPLAFSRLMLFWIWFFTLLLLGLSRLARRAILSTLYRRGIGTDRALVVGSGEVGRGVIRTLLARPDLGYQALGYLDDGISGNNIGSGRIPKLGNWTGLEKVLQEHRELNTVFIAVPGEMHSSIAHLLRTCQRSGVRAQVVPDLLQLSLNRVEFNNLAGVPTLSVRDVRVSRFQQATKRLLDLTIVILGAAPSLLVGALIALAIKLDTPGPIFFAQERVGKDGVHFRMYKFRSMVADAEERKQQLLAVNEATGPIFKIKDDPRLTRVGRIIRRLSLDELPQLHNVFRGDMSLVGPRPPIPAEVADYQPWHMQRLAVRGGITGLWQVSGRSDLTFDEQCLLDIYYIENWSISTDIRIMLQTLPFALFGRGAY
jgi:exopolysaccharide biosynthesis polyprenyl glycosylphosphotransferase